MDKKLGKRREYSEMSRCSGAQAGDQSLGSDEDDGV